MPAARARAPSSPCRGRRAALRRRLTGQPGEPLAVERNVRRGRLAAARTPRAGPARLRRRSRRQALREVADALPRRGAGSVRPSAPGRSDRGRGARGGSRAAARASPAPVMPAAPAAAGPPDQLAEQAERERLARRASGSSRGPVQAGQPASQPQARDQLRRAGDAARRDGPTAAPTGRPRPGPPRRGRSSVPPGAASGPGVTSPRSRGSTISRTAATVWIARPAPSSATSRSSRRQPPGDALGGQPVRGRLELELGQVDGAPADVLVGDELELLEERHEARDHHLAVDPPPAGRRRLGEHVERLERHGPVRVRVVVDVDPVDVGLPLAPVEPVDVVLDRLVDVDRALVDEDLGREQVHLAEHPRPVRASCR